MPIASQIELDRPSRMWFCDRRMLRLQAPFAQSLLAGSTNAGLRPYVEDFAARADGIHRVAHVLCPCSSLLQNFLGGEFRNLHRRTHFFLNGIQRQADCVWTACKGSFVSCTRGYRDEAARNTRLFHGSLLGNAFAGFSGHGFELVGKLNDFLNGFILTLTTQGPGSRTAGRS